MFCHFHNKRLAVSRCSNCDLALCPECRFLIKGQILCKKCSTIDIPDFIVIPKRKPSLAAFLSLLIPGAGQIYNGQTRKGVFILLTSWLLVPWLFGVYDAFMSARRINKDGITSAPSLLAFFVISFIVLSFYLSLYFVYQYYFGIDYQAVEVQQNLKRLSTALESYKRDKGLYPEDYLQFYNTEPRYIDELYCEIEIGPYYYSCVLTPHGYKIKAEPSQNRKDKKLKVYMMETGGLISSKE